MRHLIPFLGLFAPAIYSPIATADYFYVETCDKFVRIYNNHRSSVAMEIGNDLDCSSSPNLKSSIRGSINGNGHNISNLTFVGESYYDRFTQNVDLRDVTFTNTSLHNTDKSHPFEIDSRWSNVKFLGFNTIGQPFRSLFYELSNIELNNVEFDLSGLKLDNSDYLVTSFIRETHLTNVKFSNATVNRQASYKFGLLANSSYDSYVTNVTFSNINLLGQPTGSNGWTCLGLCELENTHVNGYTLEDISFLRTSNDAFFRYERNNNENTYVNVTHNLFDDGKEAGAIPLVLNSGDNLESRVINFQSMNKPTPPPAMCAPYLLQDSYFAIKQPEL